eukprot:6173403-Prymnesium_polylepis.1
MRCSCQLTPLPRAAFCGLQLGHITTAFTRRRGREEAAVAQDVRVAAAAARFKRLERLVRLSTRHEHLPTRRQGSGVHTAQRTSHRVRASRVCAACACACARARARACACACARARARACACACARRVRGVCAACARRVRG